MRHNPMLDETSKRMQGTLLALVAGFCLAMAGCATEPPAPEPQPVVEPKPEPPKPVFTIELQYPNGPVVFESQCNYSPYLDALRSVHSSDRNVHAVFKHIEEQGYSCDGRVERLEGYLHNLGALD